MAQAIEVKYLGETTHRGERFKAIAFGGSITVAYDYELNRRYNELAAAIALVKEMEWDDRLTVSLEHSGVVQNQNRVFTLHPKLSEHNLLIMIEKNLEELRWKVADREHLAISRELIANSLNAGLSSEEIDDAVMKILEEEEDKS